MFFGEVADLFWDGVDRSGGTLLTALGSAVTGLGAVAAGLLAFLGVLFSTNRADQRSAKALSEASTARQQTGKHHQELLSNNEREQELADLRERIGARHARFSTIVSQLASEQPTVRIGGLYALSALADEWDQELVEPDSASHSHISTEEASIRDETDRKRDYSLGFNFIKADPNEAIENRDACIGLICAYLRAEPISLEAPSRRYGFIKSQQRLAEVFHRRKENTRGAQQSIWAEQPDAMPDREARNEAIKILVRHTTDGAAHQWPGQTINLRGAHLEGALLAKINLQGAHLDDAHLEKAHLMGTHFEKVNLTNAQLQSAWLTNAYLDEAILDQANLEEAWLTNASLCGAHLYGTVLVGAIEGSSEDGSEFRLAKWDPSSRRRLRAKWNNQTKWPRPEFNPDKTAERQIQESSNENPT